MSDGFQYFDIIFFALIAVFVILRLRSALGRRTGQERPRSGDILSRSADSDDQGSGKVIHLPNQEEDSEDVVFEKELTELEEKQSGVRASSVEEVDDIRSGLSDIKKADSNFSPRTFVSGAKGAFEIIVESFAAGDTGTLRPLLGDDVYDEFVEVIRSRIAAEETVETTIVSLDTADIVSAKLHGSTARITIKFVSQQMSVTRDKDGSSVDGQTETAVRATDLWTFARNTRSDNPNWSVVETRTSD